MGWTDNVDGFGVLALLGIVLTGLGLGWTAWVIYLEWLAVADDDVYFLPTRLHVALKRPINQTLHIPIAQATGVMHAPDVTGTPDRSKTGGERISDLEAKLQELSAAHTRLDGSVKAVTKDVKTMQKQIDGLPLLLEQTERTKTIANVRHAGWGLIAAVAGLLLQVPLGVVAAIG
ncbi:hypothetical protein L5I01_28725 [Gordonia sp. HY442]|uniref:hypothetical protein n=1 Tax=Gordonia zhenghanii TaxID=2911516 RepID=UPI001F157B56|nr:hypothetical protein [Gordonia zhenghanii]MCF8607349.1 hypothetical protein [Gordonia zhenghanii]